MWLVTDLKRRWGGCIRFIEWMGGEKSDDDEPLPTQEKNSWSLKSRRHGRGTGTGLPVHGAQGHCCRDSEPAEGGPNPQSQRSALISRAE